MISIHMNDTSNFRPLRGAENPFTFNMVEHLILNLPNRWPLIGWLTLANHWGSPWNGGKFSVLAPTLGVSVLTSTPQSLSVLTSELQSRALTGRGKPNASILYCML